MRHDLRKVVPAAPSTTKIMRREKYIAYDASTRTLRDAKREVRYRLPHVKIVGGRRIHPMDVKHGFVVVYEEKGS